jgi:hypothetical protein
MPNYEAQHRGQALGIVNAPDLEAAMAIAMRIYGRVTSVHLTNRNPVAVNDESKQYFSAHCESYFTKRGLTGIQWDKLSKEDLYRIYLWSTGS